MKTTTTLNGTMRTNRILTSMAGAVLITLIPGLCQTAYAADPQLHADRDPPLVAEPAAMDLTTQLLELRAKVARLEAALDQGHKQRPQTMTTSESGMGMGRKGMMKGMGMMGGPKSRMSSDGSPDMSELGGMDTKNDGMTGGVSGGNGSKSGMKMDGKGMKDKGMRMMGMTKGMAGSKAMSMKSALPGFPGASHLYHIGATGFFLDHEDHIQVTTDQQSRLNKIREKANLEQATTDRKIDEAEQQLWELTAAGQPDAERIEAKIREIEKLRGDQRFAFIRAVGAAAKILTHQQHLTLIGME